MTAGEHWEPKGVCALVGPNGSGKSHLLSSLCTPLTDRLRYYPSWNYDLETLRKKGSPLSSAVTLNATGDNAFTVLRNWRDRRECKSQREFTDEGIKALFPWVEEINFAVGWGSVDARVTLLTLSDEEKAHPPIELSPRVLTAILHLLAVASAPRGGVVALDEPENGLHPNIIRTLFDLIYNRAREEDLTVILATHSPVLIGAFRGHPEQVYILRRNCDGDTAPVQLTSLFGLEWLSRFDLGDLFVRGEFGY